MVRVCRSSQDSAPREIRGQNAATFPKRDNVPLNRPIKLRGSAFVARVPRPLRRTLQVAVGGYAVVGLFGATYGVAGAAWPSLSTSTRVAIAVLVTAPFALALLWSRLTGLKAF